MKCPTCTTPDLVMSERAGIEIDYCPQCRGIWLDRGELDKIIERSTRLEATSQSAPDQSVRPHDQHHWGDSDRHGSHRGHDGHRKSFWREIFD